MNDLGILANINNADQIIQNEVISLAFHCAKCGKFKKKNTKSQPPEKLPHLNIF